MKFIISRLSDRQSPPVAAAKLVGKTLFDDPVYAIEVNTIDELLQLCARSQTSAPGDIGLLLWRRAPQSASLTDEFDGMPMVEIYDELPS
jgi:hypothetical protein